jgi:hypothetical protein
MRSALFARSQEHCNPGTQETRRGRQEYESGNREGHCPKPGCPFVVMMKPIANPAMTTHCKCHPKQHQGDCRLHSSDSVHPQGNLARRLLKIVQGTCSAIILLLMPKCPVCVAAYVATFTGVGLSINAANTVRILTLFFAGCSVIYLVARQLRSQAFRTLGRSFAENVEP